MNKHRLNYYAILYIEIMRLLFNINIEVGSKIYVNILLKLWHFCLKNKKICDNYLSFILFYIYLLFLYILLSY
jgi:hypothetical protein